MTSSRREFLKTAAAGSLGLTSFSAFAGIPVGCELKTPTKWDMTTDVVVAGSGAAGMAAAICAIEQGVKVDVFEKEKENYGGCAFICGGILNLQGGTRLQKSQGSKDTPEAYYKRLTDPKDPQMRKNNRALMKKVSQLSPAMQEWLEARGVKFFEHYQSNSNSDSQHTATYHTIWWSDPGEARPKPQPQGGFMSGQGIMIPLRRHFESKGGQIHFGHKIVDVYKDDSGKVIGAKAEKTDGSIVNIRATRGVVLAGAVGRQMLSCAKFQIRGLLKICSAPAGPSYLRTVAPSWPASGQEACISAVLVMTTLGRCAVSSALRAITGERVLSMAALDLKLPERSGMN